MKKYIAFLALALCAKNNLAQTGIVVGINGFGYKSNLYNKYDLDATKNKPNVLSYIRSYGTSFGLEVGYQLKNQIIISIEPQISKINQKYKGVAEFDNPLVNYWNSNLNTSLKFIKIPITLTKLFGTSKIKLLSSVGLDYWKLNSYSETYSKTSPNHNANTFEKIIKNNSFEMTGSNFSSKGNATMSDYIYQKTIFGAHAGIGASYSLSNKFQIYTKINVEYTFGNIENKDSIDFKADNTQSYWLNGKAALFAGSDIKYFAKEYSDPVTNERSNTHIFNLGLMIGIRFIIPQ